MLEWDAVDTSPDLMCGGGQNVPQNLHNGYSTYVIAERHERN